MACDCAVWNVDLLRGVSMQPNPWYRDFVQTLHFKDVDAF